MYLTGRTGNQLIVVNSVEMKLPVEWNVYIKRLFASSISVDVDNTSSINGLITKEDNSKLYGILTDKSLNSYIEFLDNIKTYSFNKRDMNQMETLNIHCDLLFYLKIEKY